MPLPTCVRRSGELTHCTRPVRVRGSPIEAVILTGAEIDQTAGLLNLRERHSFAVFGTASTLAMLDANPMFSALAPDLVERKVTAVDTAFRLPGGLSAELFAVPGKVPLYLENGMSEDSRLRTAPMLVSKSPTTEASWLLFRRRHQSHRRSKTGLRVPTSCFLTAPSLRTMK